MNANVYHYDTPQNNELQGLAELLGQALIFRVASADELFQHFDRRKLRVVRVGDNVAAGLGIIDMAQWWGGRRVSAAGIFAVGVAPEHRGAGVGAELIRGMLTEQREAGTALSVLYASTLAFYRSAGYERAGSSVQYELPMAALPTAGSELSIVRMEPEERELPRRLHDALGPAMPGRLERDRFLWESRLRPPIHIYAALRGDEPEGYVALAGSTDRQQPLAVRDFCALNAAAGRRLLRLLADHRSMLTAVRWNGTPNDPIVALLPEQSAQVKHMEDWVLRIVDVTRALETRGYAPGSSAELHLELHDRVLPANAGRWLVRIADGTATVESGGEGRISLDIRDLAAIYTGHRSPFDRRYAGELSGSDADLAVLGAVFAGPPPCMNDTF